MNYQELANENLFKNNFDVCDVSPLKGTYGRGFTAEIGETRLIGAILW